MINYWWLEFFFLNTMLNEIERITQRRWDEKGNEYRNWLFININKKAGAQPNHRVLIENSVDLLNCLGQNSYVGQREIEA